MGFASERVSRSIFRCTCRTLLCLPAGMSSMASCPTGARKDLTKEIKRLQFGKAAGAGFYRFKVLMSASVWSAIT